MLKYISLKESSPNLTHFGGNKFPSCVGNAEIELALKLIWVSKLTPCI